MSVSVNVLVRGGGSLRVFVDAIMKALHVTFHESDDAWIATFLNAEFYAYSEEYDDDLGLPLSTFSLVLGVRDNSALRFDQALGFRQYLAVAIGQYLSAALPGSDVLVLYDLQRLLTYIPSTSSDDLESQFNGIRQTLPPAPSVSARLSLDEAQWRRLGELVPAEQLPKGNCHFLSVQARRIGGDLLICDTEVAVPGTAWFFAQALQALLSVPKEPSLVM